MTRYSSPGFFFQLHSLLLAVILVHVVYLGMVYPKANALLIEQQELAENNPDYVPERSAYTVLSGYEQEACFILMLWAFAILLYKARGLKSEYRLLVRRLLSIPEGKRILPEATNIRQYVRQLQGLSEKEQKQFLPDLLKGVLRRFEITRDVQATSGMVRDQCALQSEELESDLSMIRYVAWAIPSVGFIGTVRGIGQALGQAHKAVEGDITGVTTSLGLAFDSTLVALLISIVLMFCVHQMQRYQERFILEAESYCNDHLIRHLHA